MYRKGGELNSMQDSKISGTEKDLTLNIWVKLEKRSLGGSRKVIRCTSKSDVSIEQKSRDSNPKVRAEGAPRNSMELSIDF